MPSILLFSISLSLSPCGMNENHEGDSYVLETFSFSFLMSDPSSRLGIIRLINKGDSYLIMTFIVALCAQEPSGWIPPISGSTTICVIFDRSHLGSTSGQHVR